MQDLRFPIGKFIKPEIITEDSIAKSIEDISLFPSRLRSEVANLSDSQLGTPYRPDGWTIRQVVHHCADSHMNSFIRFKLALTEENPTIKPYMEDRWAELPDSKGYAIEPSLQILEGLHNRWTVLLNSLGSKELNKTFVHPEHGKAFALKEVILTYGWHCNHHLAHITELKKSRGWQ